MENTADGSGDITEDGGGGVGLVPVDGSEAELIAHGAHVDAKIRGRIGSCHSSDVSGGAFAGQGCDGFAGEAVVDVQFAELLHVPPVPPIHSWSTAQEIWGQAATIAARWAGRKRTSGLRFIISKIFGS